MKFCIICYIHAEMSYLGESGSWDMSQNALAQSDSRKFESSISLKQYDKMARFLYIDINL